MEWNLYQIVEKNKSIEVHYCYKHDAFDLTKIALYSANDTLQCQNTLYIISEADIGSISIASFHWLIIGLIPADFPIQKTLSVSSISASNNILDVFFSLQSGLLAFQKWESKIYKHILDGVSLRDTLDTCAKMLNNPIALFDTQQTLLAYSGKIPDTSKNRELWDYVIKHGHSPIEIEMENKLARMVQEATKPFYFKSDNRYKNIQRLIAPLRSKDSFFGVLALSDVAARFTRGEYATVCKIQYYISQAITHSQEFHFITQDSPWFIVQLLRGQRVDVDVLTFNLMRYSVSTDEPFTVWTFQRNGNDSVDIKSLMPNISYLLDSSTIFIYANQIVVIDYKNKKRKSSDFKNHLTSLLKKNNLQYGRSMIFHNLSQLHQAFMQTQIALSTTRTGQGNDFLDVYHEYLLHILETQTDSVGIVFPKLDMILKESPDFAKELLLTIKSYILNGKNLTATAKDLFIHRHTVLYRIKRIETILEIELDSLSQNEAILLFICCSRLLSSLR